MLFKEYRTTGAKPVHFTELFASLIEQVDYFFWRMWTSSPQRIATGRKHSVSIPLKRANVSKQLYVITICKASTVNKTEPKKKILTNSNADATSFFLTNNLTAQKIFFNKKQPTFEILKNKWRGKGTPNHSNKVCVFLGGIHFTMNFFTTKSSLPPSKNRQGKLLPQNLLPALSPSCYSLHFHAWFKILSCTKEEDASGNNLSSNSAATQSLPILSS